MVKQSPPDITAISNYLKSLRSDNLNYQQVFELLGRAMSIASGLVLTSLPRGSLQIAQPQRVSEGVLKGYSREFHAFDRISWQAIKQDKPMRGSDSWPDEGYQNSRFYREFMIPNGFAFVASAPLAGPVIHGYPGAIQVYRITDQGEFTDAELRTLGEVAAMLDRAITQTRSIRKAKPAGVDSPHKHQRIGIRQFIFDKNLNPQLGTDLGEIDQRLRQQMIQAARTRFEHVNGKEAAGDRVSLPDSRGDLWVFRVVTHKKYPALGEGPFVIFSLQPECGEWGVLRSTDFSADAEIARLIPALRFMEEHFHRGPTLNEIARTVHLSPFHFHRRFTELLGITPKHFLLECQIQRAKRELVSGEKELAEIATACGFAHQSHFTSRFKQATGLTPTRWRRMSYERAKAAGEI